MSERQLIQIDLEKVLRQKLGDKVKYVPKGLVHWLERTICKDELNAMLRKFYPKTGADFCNATLDYLNVSIGVKNPDAFPSEEDKRAIFVSNHPLGGLDGIALIAEMTNRYGKGVKFIVNDLLMVIDPISDVFLPINKHGKQSRDSIEAINEAMQGEDPIVIFPAGLVSRKGNKGEIKDLDWNKMFVSKAIQYKRDVVPLHFSGYNSPKFYNIARWRKRLGINFNIEMLYLPQEMIISKGKKFIVTVGSRIDWQNLMQCDPYVKAQQVKDIVYSLDK